MHTEVHFVTLDVDGTPRHEATRISAPGEPGRSSFTFGGRRGIVPVGDGVWVAYIENTADDETQLGSREIVIAVVDAEGNADLHRLQDLGDGEESRVPLFVPYDDHVGLMWTTGHIIWICAGCISDHDAHFVLLDAQDLVPASNVATHLHVDNGLTRPWVGELGENLLTTSSLDFHAVSIAASGAMRCEAPG